MYYHFKIRPRILNVGFRKTGPQTGVEETDEVGKEVTSVPLFILRNKN